jgi:protocatechuate 3,4-dioxygenase beta subunit
MRMIIEDESQLTGAVLMAMAKAPNERLRVIMESLVRHLHAFAREVRPTDEEWERGLAFVTGLGQVTNDSHNETMLAADILGVSTLVGMLNGPTWGGETAAALLGPFWRLNSPELQFDASIARDGTPGIPVQVSGHVTCQGKPVAGAVVDIWQADPRGMYDNQIEGLEGMNLRGHFRTTAEGRYQFRTVRPSGYPVPTHGPSGELLRAQRRAPFRPAHIHFMVSKPGFRTLITQVFVDDSERLDDDVTFSVVPSLIGQFEIHETPSGAPAGFAVPWGSLVYDIALAHGESRFPTPPIR